MAKEKKIPLSGGSSDKNSVSFFLAGYNNGIMATRQKDGTISVTKVDSEGQTKLFLKLVKIMSVLSIFREFIFLLNWPKIGFLYHMPTIFWILISIIAIVYMLSNREMRMYHGAEHKVANCYSKVGTNFEKASNFSRLHSKCGTNVISTIVTFQLASSICWTCFNFHIPDVITAALPFFVYKIFPFNFLGLIVQLVTTANPTDYHIEVAIRALSELLQSHTEK